MLITAGQAVIAADSRSADAPRCPGGSQQEQRAPSRATGTRPVWKLIALVRKSRLWQSAASAIMSPFKLLLPLVGLLVVMSPAWGNEQNVCASSAGTLLIGTVISVPHFAHGYDRRGVELSHTHIRLSGMNGRIYDIAIDDVFADGYDQAGEGVPAPLSRIKPGDRLELCGRPYTGRRAGMDWVHSNCGDEPTPDHPNGWVKVLSADGRRGPNLEANPEYCRLWRRR